MSTGKRVPPNRAKRIAALVLFLICWQEARWVFPSLAAADWRDVHWEHTEWWSFGLSGGFSMGGFTGQQFGFGPWVLHWSIPEFGSIAFYRAGNLMDLIGLIGAGWLLWRLLPVALQKVLARKADRWVAFVDWALPVRGRWARYLVGTMLVLIVGFLLVR